MKWLAIIAALLIAMPAFAQSKTGPSTAMTPAPDDRAKQWLTLVDDQNYADAYKQMGVAARGKVSAEEFAKSVGGVREPLGAMSSRALKDVKLAKTLAAMRDGQYAVVRYDSNFAHKSAAVESVTMVLEKDGWSVIGYFIK